MTCASEPRRALVLGLCGSLRAGSTNRTLLMAASRIAPNGVDLLDYRGVGDLPHYNPDDDVDPLPASVVQLRALVGKADGLLVSCPEYAAGIPGAFKNALDWLVGGDEMHAKPVAIWRPSSRGEVATAALRLVLRMVAARIVDEHVCSSWPGGRSARVEDLLRDTAWTGEVRGALDRFCDAIQNET